MKVVKILSVTCWFILVQVAHARQDPSTVFRGFLYCILKILLTVVSKQVKAGTSAKCLRPFKHLELPFCFSAYYLLRYFYSFIEYGLQLRVSYQ